MMVMVQACCWHSQSARGAGSRRGLLCGEVLARSGIADTSS